MRRGYPAEQHHSKPEAYLYRTFIFFGSALTTISPAVFVWWPGEVIHLFTQFPAGALHYGSFASHTCADFIAACSAVEKTRGGAMEVSNLPLRWEGQELLTTEFNTPAYTFEWRAWLFAEIDRVYADVTDPQKLPILVDIDPPYHATQGGTVLLQRHSGRAYREGDPEWLTPAQVVRLAKERGADQ